MSSAQVTVREAAPKDIDNITAFNDARARELK